MGGTAAVQSPLAVATLATICLMICLLGWALLEEASGRRAYAHSQIFGLDAADLEPTDPTELDQADPYVADADRAGPSLERSLGGAEDIYSHAFDERQFRSDLAPAPSLASFPDPISDPVP